MKSFARTLALSLALLAAAPAAPAADAKVGAGGTAAAHAERIVVQVSEADGKYWMATLGNLRNIRREYPAGGVRFAVVVIGHALPMLAADSIAANDVQDALAAGVEFLACGNSMQAQHVALDDLVDGVKITPAGYVEIVRRQRAGWAYLRP